MKSQDELTTADLPGEPFIPNDKTQWAASAVDANWMTPADMWAELEAERSTRVSSLLSVVSVSLVTESTPEGLFIMDRLWDQQREHVKGIEEAFGVEGLGLHRQLQERMDDAFLRGTRLPECDLCLRVEPCHCGNSPCRCTCGRCMAPLEDTLW